MNKLEAKEVIVGLLNILGPGYHPDNSLIEYHLFDGDEDLGPTFSSDDIIALELAHDEALTVLGNDVYLVIEEYLKDSI